jgi:pimeloyl-ACP methyl ester carboxylesterase
MQDEQLCNNIKEMNRRVGPEIFMRHQAAIMGRPDSRNDLSKIKCPTLILCGRQDALTPLEVHEEMSSTIPKARLAIIEDCGHMTTMERPHAVTALLRDLLVNPLQKKMIMLVGGRGGITPSIERVKRPDHDVSQTYQ